MRVQPTVSVASLRIPQKAWAHFEKAKAAAERNRPAEAERESARALEIAPRFAEVYVFRATQQVRGHDFQAAIASAEAARQADPDATWASVVLAGAYNGMQRYDDALAALHAARPTEAETWQAKYEQARAEIGLRHVEEALRLSAEALDSAPETFADARLVRGNALLIAGRWGEAAAQMHLYLQSAAPQSHRAEVEQVLAQTEARMQRAQMETIASR
jgi:tetratricopeptide (TPR) repeat protein